MIKLSLGKQFPINNMIFEFFDEKGNKICCINELDLDKTVLQKIKELINTKTSLNTLFSILPKCLHDKFFKKNFYLIFDNYLINKINSYTNGVIFNKESRDLVIGRNRTKFNNLLIILHLLKKDPTINRNYHEIIDNIYSINIQNIVDTKSIIRRTQILELKIVEALLFTCWGEKEEELIKFLENNKGLYGEINKTIRNFPLLLKVALWLPERFDVLDELGSQDRLTMLKFLMKKSHINTSSQHAQSLFIGIIRSYIKKGNFEEAKTCLKDLCEINNVGLPNKRQMSLEIHCAEFNKFVLERKEKQYPENTQFEEKLIAFDDEESVGIALELLIPEYAFGGCYLNIFPSTQADFGRKKEKIFSKNGQLLLLKIIDFYIRKNDFQKAKKLIEYICEPKLIYPYDGYLSPTKVYDYGLPSKKEILQKIEDLEKKHKINIENGFEMQEQKDMLKKYKNPTKNILNSEQNLPPRPFDFMPPECRSGGKSPVNENQDLDFAQFYD